MSQQWNVGIVAIAGLLLLSACAPSDSGEPGPGDPGGLAQPRDEWEPGRVDAGRTRASRMRGPLLGGDRWGRSPPRGSSPWAT